MLFSREVIKQAQRHIPAHGNNRKDRRFAGGVGAANPKPAAAPLVPKKNRRRDQSPPIYTNNCRE
jgi:hypothetical protein